MGVGGLPELDTLIGQAVGGDYVLRRLLGRGGMGAVYEADHVRLPRRFAVKFLLVGGARSGEAMARFRREAEIASQLDSPHIASVVDFNQLDDGTPYFVMDLLDGESLGARLAARPLERDEIVLLARQIGEALATAHARGVIHRDLKPENVFLTRTDGAAPFAVKLLDFGISKVAGASMTRTDTILGTPAYMSPEQARGDHKKLDARSDVYSFGALLYEVFAGRCPFPGENTFEVLSQVALDMPPPIEGVPRAINRILQRALAKEPADRPASARELVEAVERALGEASSWRPPERRATDLGGSAGSLGETRATGIGSAPTAAEVAGLPRGGRRRRRKWLVLAVVSPLVAAAAGAGIAMLRAPAESSSPAPADPAPPAARAEAPPPPAPSESPPSPAAPERVRIRLRVTPAGARVLLDGREPIAGDVLELERSGVPRTLLVRATGFADKTLTVVPDQEKELAIRLDRKAGRPAGHKKRTGRGEDPAPLIGGGQL